MIDYCPIILMGAILFFWLGLARSHKRFVDTFWQRLPLVAAQELDSVIGRNIQNGLYPFTRRAGEVLRGDEVLWKMRRRILFWGLASFLVPFLGMLTLGTFLLLRFR